MVRYCVFDTETTGLPKKRNANPLNHELFPHVVQLSWVIYDDVKCTIDKIEDHIACISVCKYLCSYIIYIFNTIQLLKQTDIDKV